MTTPNNGSGLPTDWPDAAEIERIANELFSAIPGETSNQAQNTPTPPAVPGGFGGIPSGSSAPPSVPGGMPFAGATLTAPVTSTAPYANGAPQHLPFDMPSGFPGGLPFEDVPHNLSPEALLGPAEGSPVPMSVGSSSTAPSYYFLEYANANTGTIAPPVYDHRIPSTASPVSVPFDVFKVRRDFPILNERVNGRPLIWLDNAATTQKPQAVIDRLKYFYEHENSNIHRAAHELAARATNAYEEAREKVRGFLNAASPKEIVFVRGATEAINLVAQTWGRQNIHKGDEIIISWLEHHANIVPWQILANEKGAHLRVIPVDDDGQIQLEEFGKLLGPKTKLVSFTHVSNALGTVTPVRQMIEMARSAGAKVLLDGAQSVSHMKVDVQSLNPDWFVFSGHKLFAPTGIGVLYGKEALLNDMPPWQGGGNMIKDVTFERTQYHDSPERFEAGTGNIADAVGLGAAIDYLNKIGMDFIHEYEHQLLQYATRALKDCPGLRFIGTAAEKAGVLSFVLDGFTTEEVGSALSKEGIALRSGHHCAQPILRRFGVESTVRPSLAFYNVCSDIDALAAAVNRLASSRSFTAPVNRIAT